MANPVEFWKAEKHPFDVWPDVERYAAAATPMKDIDTPDLERLKWHGFFYRKRDAPGRYMNRIRITAGELTAEQAREIAYMAYEYGHGIIDVTTRANLQVQGLEIVHLLHVAARLQKVGLTSKQTGHDNIRNVFAHPFSGLMPDELIDTRQLCTDVTALFVDSRVYSDLPRKFNICLNGTEQHSAHFWTQDISFLATAASGRARLLPSSDQHPDGGSAGASPSRLAGHNDGSAGGSPFQIAGNFESSSGDVLFQLLIGGTQGQNPHLAWHLPVLVRPEQVVEVTRSLLDLFRAQGSREKRNAARFRFLIEEIGVTGVLDWLAHDLPFPLQPCVAEPIPAAGRDELVGWFRQSDPKLWTMGLSVPLGRMTWQQLEGLSRLSAKWGDGNLRTTHEQGIAVVNIPSGFRDAAATDAAALGLSVHADDFERNTMACTGSQFCNIAVTETKGHMFQLVEKLRKRALKLHGIRIHMSGCPSSCAQHFTADVGLKGVRVRRLVGTREGFDVYLGGGIAGQVHMALPYRLGVDVDQLPKLIEDVVGEYYLRHKAGQTFSAYWREKLIAAEAAKVGDDDYRSPVWLCEGCEYRHDGEDPPVFCPSCAGLRRYFARLEEGAEPATSPEGTERLPLAREDGFVYAAKAAALADDQGLTVEVQGREYALFLIDGEVKCIDAACPHEGASLADGEVNNGVVTCPWHGWTFNACTGCSLDPPGNDVGAYETLEEDGHIFIKPLEVDGNGHAATATPTAHQSAAKPTKPKEAVLPVLEVIHETPDVRTFRLDNRQAAVPFELPGQFAKVCISDEDGEVWRTFTISSSPTKKDKLELTIKLNPAGCVSRFLFENVAVGDTIRLKGAQGGFYFDPARHSEPLVLISAGSGITPMMSIARFLEATGSELPCTFLYGARTPADIIFHDECLRLAEEHAWFRYFVTLSQPSESWLGEIGRLEYRHVEACVRNVAECRYFLCGPNDFMEMFRSELTAAGVPLDRIHTEQFHKSKQPATV